MINEGRRWNSAMALVVLLSAPLAAGFAPEAQRFTAFAVSMTNGATGQQDLLLALPCRGRRS